MSLNDLEPKLLWNNFIALTRIPRPSGSEEKIRDYLMSWAEKRGFDSQTDDAGNLVIRVPSSEGFGESTPIIIQGHMDMVAEMNSDSKVDPSKDPLDL
jgi:dipeptidase D